MSEDVVTREQAEVCQRFGVAPVAAPAHLKVGVARDARTGLRPLNGLRHPPQEGTTGWFIWAGGEPSSEPDFFEPLHVSHVAESMPDIVAYLALPPGWRFQIAPGYEDVWEDRALLDI